MAHPVDGTSRGQVIPRLEPHAAGRHSFKSLFFIMLLYSLPLPEVAAERGDMVFSSPGRGVFPAPSVFPAPGGGSDTPGAVGSRYRPAVPIPHELRIRGSNTPLLH